MSIAVCVLLSACYTPSQPRFEQQVRSWIRNGMPFAEAISRLGTHGMVCTGGNPTSCARSRGGLYSCNERVNVGFAEPYMLVSAIEVPNIRCIGGF